MVVRYSSEYKSDLERLTTAMHQESVKFCDMSLDTDKLVNIAEKQYCGLYLKNNTPVGCMLGVKHQTFFGHDVVATELLLFIEPEHRGGFAAIRLAQDFEKWCKENKCVEINVGSSVQVATDTTKKLYSALGYTERGFVAYKEL